MKGSETSPRRGVIYLRPPGSHRDITGWFRASFAGSCSCIILYTLFGLFFVRLHARMISEESAIIAASGMTPLIYPGDPHLAGLFHQFASAMFFGLTLGVLAGLVCMVVTLPAWLSGRIVRFDLAGLVCAGLACIYFTYSRELPLVPIAAGILCPVFFTLPWALVLRAGTRRAVRWGRWALFTAALVSPLALTLVPGSSFLNARDAMVTLPLVQSLSDFYYSHTLLAADVIKPLSARTQNVIALSRDIEEIGRMPHGTLWVRAQDPCMVQGARIRLAREELPCPSVILPDGRPANEGNRVYSAFGPGFDHNALMRGGIGIFFYSGPMLLMTALLLSWLAMGLERLSGRSILAAMVVVAAYLALFVPGYHGAYLLHRLKEDPRLIMVYAASPVERERYLAVVTYPGALPARDLTVMMEDPSARVRLNALVEAGQRRDLSLLPAVAARAFDPQVNVRTKACWALGRMETSRSLQILGTVMRKDPAWYVRDYAYAASGRIVPETRMVDLD